ncbi:uncharacterized protein BJ171DRAFT_582034 [Polychytrium aggregatum]|uniref:uncharacterized protein n=1 Tax=Polychytrium aggregatum TaxID=110093 RepID=UPI0022FE493E|nr:uncharacterized protein BJ171DRAFT_582034 [Polychytrium aggregatum]KAI9204467.1 hypothetical protein BJ171DRAFT_582034 [Polychytrium aggregatum]
MMQSAPISQCPSSQFIQRQSTPSSFSSSISSMHEATVSASDAAAPRHPMVKLLELEKQDLIINSNRQNHRNTTIIKKLSRQVNELQQENSNLKQRAVFPSPVARRSADRALSVLQSVSESDPEASQTDITNDATEPLLTVASSTRSSATASPQPFSRFSQKRPSDSQKVPSPLDQVRHLLELASQSNAPRSDAARQSTSPSKVSICDVPSPGLYEERICELEERIRDLTDENVLLEAKYRDRQSYFQSQRQQCCSKCKGSLQENVSQLTVSKASPTKEVEEKSVQASEQSIHPVTLEFYSTKISQLDDRIIELERVLGVEKDAHAKTKELLREAHQEVKAGTQQYEKLASKVGTSQVWKKTVEEQKLLIDSYSKQLMDSERRIKHYRDECEKLAKSLNEFNHIASLTHEVNKRSLGKLCKFIEKHLGATSEGLVPKTSKSANRLDLSDLVEHLDSLVDSLVTRSQADSESHRQLNAKLQSENEELDQRLQLIKRTMITQKEWSQITEERDQARVSAEKLKKDMKEKEADVETMRERILKLTNEGAFQKNELKILKAKTEQQKQDLLSKDAHLKEATESLSRLNAMNEAQEAKIKVLTHNQLNKELVMKDLRSKNEGLHEDIQKSFKMVEELEELRKVHRKCKSEIVRKDGLIHMWKERADALSREIVDLKARLDSTVDNKKYASAVQTKQLASEKAYRLQEKYDESVKKLEHIENAVRMFLEARLSSRKPTSELQSDSTVSNGSAQLLDSFETEMLPEDVVKTAEKISKTILNLDYRTLLKAPPEGVMEISQLDEKLRDM